jgi:hypothetical protein
MTSLQEVQQANRDLALQLNETTRKDPSSPYRGKFVGIANGKVVIVTDDFQELYRSLRDADSDPRRVFWVEAGHDPEKIEYVWSC